MNTLGTTLVEGLWTVAGAGMGLFLVLVVVAAHASRRTRAAELTRAHRWAATTAALEALHAEPSNNAARTVLAEALADPGEADQTLSVIATVLTLQPGDPRLAAALVEVGVTTAMLKGLTAGHGDLVVHALIVSGLIGDRSVLPHVLMHTTDRNEQTRRAALEALSRLAPITAFDRLLSAIGDEGPWALEQLVALVRSGSHLSWVDSQAAGEASRHRRLGDLVARLMTFATEPNSPRPIMVVDALGAIDHRAARQALVGLVMGASATTALAAARALAAHDDGVAMLDRLRRSGAPGASTADLLLTETEAGGDPTGGTDGPLPDLTTAGAAAPSLRLA
jgi:HEAT repeat protein